jgi:hypothetical protein
MEKRTMSDHRDPLGFMGSEPITEIANPAFENAQRLN